MPRYGSAPVRTGLAIHAMRSDGDLGTRVRKLPKDYKKAMAMAIAGKTYAEILAELELTDLDEAEVKEKMEGLLKYLRLDSFQDAALQARPVRRALKDFSFYSLGPE